MKTITPTTASEEKRFVENWKAYEASTEDLPAEEAKTPTAKATKTITSRRSLGDKTIEPKEI